MYDITDNRGVPISSGVPPVVTWTIVFSITLALIVVSCVIFASRYGHVWPSLDSTHLKLG